MKNGVKPNKKVEADTTKSGQRRLIWCYVRVDFKLKIKRDHHVICI